MDNAQYLDIAPDHRVQLALAGQLGQVARVFLQRAVAGFGLRVGHPLAAAHLLDGVVDPLSGDPSTFQQSGSRGAALAQDGQEDVLGGDVLVFQPVGLFVGQVDNAFHPRGDEDLSRTPTKDIGFRAGA